MGKSVSKGSDRFYYYSLYFTIAHMAAYVAIIILLVTIGMLLCFSNVPSLNCVVRYTSLAAIFILTCGGMFAAWKMVQLGENILLGLGHEKEKVPKFWFIKLPYNQWLAILVAFLIGLWDFCLILFFP